MGTPVEQCRINNERLLAEVGLTSAYDQDVFNDLVYRYEEPNGMNRWDSPLFTVLLEDEAPPFDQIWNAVVASDGKIKTAKPNAATLTVIPAWVAMHLHQLTVFVGAGIRSRLPSRIRQHHTNHSIRYHNVAERPFRCRRRRVCKR